MMAGAAHDPAFAKKVGVPQKVAKEFNAADAGTGIIQPKPKAKKAPPNKGKATKGTFVSAPPKDRSDY